MKVVKEIAVAVENVPGTLAHVAACLGEKKVNILAISVHEAAPVSIIRMVVDKPAVAIKILKGYPATLRVTEALQVDVPNKPGQLAKLAGKLAKKRVNIDYLYGSAIGSARERIIIHTANAKKAESALKRR